MSNLNYPLGITSKDFNENTSGTYKICIKDPLQKSYAKVNGIEFDCHATVWLTRSGEDGPIMVDSLEIDRPRDIELVTYDDNGDVKLFKVVLNEHWSRALEDAIEKLAIDIAANKPFYEWTKQEEE